MGVHLYTNGAWTDSGRIYRNSENIFNIATWENVIATRGIIDIVANGIKLTATGNDAFTQTYGNFGYSLPVSSGETYSLSWNIDDPNIYGVVYLFSGIETAASTLVSVAASQEKVSFTIPVTHNYLAFRLGVATSGDTLTYTNIMLNTGSTALPFEPYNVVDWYTNHGHGYSSGAWS